MVLRRRGPAVRRFWLCVVVVGVVALAIAPSSLVAADCSECDAGCQLEADAFQLMQAYAEDKAGFAARSNRCAETDAVWTEIYENIREMDQPPPRNEVTRRREISKFELAMINHELGIRSCLLLCGHERFQENCIAGPGGKSCDCKPGAEAYCRAQRNQGVVDSIAPSYSGGGGPSSTSSDEGGSEGDDHQTETTESDSDLEEDADQEPLYLIEIAVSADGFLPRTVSKPCYVEPSSVTAEGRIVDDTGAPLPGARVSLVGLGETTRTDADGRFSLTAATEGDTPFHAHSSIRMVRQVSSLQATVTPSSTVWANGREVEAVLTVLADGQPYAGKIVTLADWKGFDRGGSPVDYVVPGRGNHHNLLLDDAGTATFRFVAPVVPRDRGATIQNPDELFPVEGHFRVKLRNQDVETECGYQIASPFPKVSRIRVPGNVDAGLWQKSPSTIVVEDPDSDRFTVTVRGLGHFRTTQPGAARKPGILTHELSGKQFEFLYRPPEMGLDPTALPDTLDQFMNTNKNIYISVVTNVAGGMLLDQLKVVSKGGVLDKGLVLIGADTDANTYLDAASNMANLLNNATHFVENSGIAWEGPEKAIIGAGNQTIGLIDTGFGFDQTLKNPKAKLKWEAVKAYWEYLKLINSIQNQYEELASAYQDTRFYPIEITVDDESGHRVTASRACSVRIWKGGSQ